MKHTIVIQPLPTTSTPYASLVAMYQSNCGLTRQEAIQRANRQFPREPVEVSVTLSDDRPPF